MSVINSYIEKVIICVIIEDFLIMCVITEVFLIICAIYCSYMDFFFWKIHLFI